MPDRQVIKWGNLRYYLVGAYEVGGRTTSCTVSASADTQSAMVAGSPAMVRDGGLVDHSVTFEGFDTQARDWDAISGSTVITVPRALGAVGDPVIFGRSVRGTYDIGMPVGQYQTVTMETPINDGLARGKVLGNQIDTPVTAVGTGAEVEISAVTAAQRLRASLHVTAFTGTSATFVVQSDETGFASPVDRVTFDPVTAVGAQVGEVVGPISPDTFYRWSVSGTFTSINFFIAAAVSPI